MNDPQEVLSRVLSELAKLQGIVTKHRARQITNADDRDLLKSVAYAWFRSHREALGTSSAPDLSAVDRPFQAILEATDRAVSKATYLAAIKDATKQVRSLRAYYLVPTVTAPSSEAPPDFSPLAADLAMRGILSGRWEECQRCIGAGAHLAATVMMGGLLEALFVARANAMSDKAPLFKAKLTPTDSKTGKPISLKDWTLRPYIDVGHELGWITKSGKDIAVVLRDYRNLVHPEKQRSLGIDLNEHDSRMFWEVTKSLSRQLVHIK
jgi:hypothetical protein